MRQRRLMTLLLAVGLCGAFALEATGRARRPSGPARPAARPAADPDARIVVSEEPPPPPAAKAVQPAKPTQPVPRWRRYSAYSRRATTLYLRDRPEGTPTIQLRIGLEMRVVRPGPKWTEVETDGLIRVRGWVPSVVLGLRVQRNAHLYSAPGGKSLGQVAMGQLVHVVKTQGTWAQVRLMGYLPLEVWMKRAALGTGATSYGRLRGRYPGGSTMVVSAGPIHAAADGPRVGQIRDEGRIYRVRVVGRWSQVAMYDYSRVQLRLWVPTDRLRWGGYPWYGTGYYTSNCKVGQHGSQVALAEFKVYAARDDAWPTIRILPGARFNLAASRDGWVRISSTSCISFNAFAEDRPGDWTPAHLYRK